jgi:hypothetical protein
VKNITKKQLDKLARQIIEIEKPQDKFDKSYSDKIERIIERLSMEDLFELDSYILKHYKKDLKK